MAKKQKSSPKKTDLDFYNYKSKDPKIKEIYELLNENYIELQNFRKKYNKLKVAKNNPFTGNLSMDTKSQNPNILRSHFISTAVEIFARGMAFPVHKIDAKKPGLLENRNKQAVARAVNAWMIRSTGFEDIYEESKDRWISYGDSYRRPYARRLKRTMRRANKKLEEKNPKPINREEQEEEIKMFPQYEDVSGYNLIFDNTATHVTSENYADSISFFGYTKIYTREDLIRRFGKWVLEYAQPGAAIDLDEHARKTGGGTNSKRKFYEVIEYQNCADLQDIVFVGKNMLPVLSRCEDWIPDLKGIKKDHENEFLLDDEYIHFNTFGEAVLILHNNYMYFNEDGVRNFGVAQKLYTTQVAHEIIENAKLDSTRRKMLEIPVISGGSTQIVKNQIQEWKEESYSNILAVLHLPEGLQGAVPQTSTIRFEGISAQEANQSTDDIHNIARNSLGVSLSRLEVQSGLGVGQSEILEEEKTVSVEAVVKRNVSNLRREFVGLINFFVNMKGFNLDDEITYTKWETREGADREIEFENPHATISLKEAAKFLEDFEFELFIDRNSIVEKSQIAIVDKLIDYLGTVDLNALPEVGKMLMKRIAQILRIDIPDGAFDNIAQSVPQGGKSQFKASGQPPQEPGKPGRPTTQEAMTPEQASAQLLSNSPENVQKTA